MNEEVVQDAETNSGHQDCVMEEVIAQIVVSQQSVGTSSIFITDVLWKTIEEIKDDNALVNERLEKQDMVFKLILSRLLPPPQNPYHLIFLNFFGLFLMFMFASFLPVGTIQ